MHSQPFGEDEFVATQAFGDEDLASSEPDAGSLVRLVAGQPAGTAASLPGATGIDVLALGRDVQPLARASEGGDLGVQTLQLLDPLLPVTPMVSGL